MLKVVSARPDGIGTRLLTILYARQFAEKMGLPFHAHWPDLADPNYKNDSLLTADSVSDIFADGKLFRDVDVEWLHGEYTAAQKVARYPHHAADKFWAENEMRAFLSRAQMMVYDAPLPILFQGSDSVADAKQIRHFWNQLNFRLDVRKGVVKVLDGVDMESCVAVHVRRGDILNILDYGDLDTVIRTGITQIFQRYIPFKTVVDTIYEKFPGSKSILVCSEDPDVAKRLRDRFPEKKVVSSSGIFPLGSNKAALLDIILLSRAHWIVSPYKSLFSECASRVGRYAKLHNGDLDVWNIALELVERLDHLKPTELNERKAIVYTTAYQNLWNLPRDPFRGFALDQAKKLSPDIVARMLA